MSRQRFTIELDFEYWAYHGFYESESTKGNLFRVEIQLWMDAPAAKPVRDIGSTVDYAEVYGIAKQVMDQREDLLETVSSRLVRELNMNYKQLNEIKVKVTKMNPPIEGYSGTVSVTCHQTF